MSKIEEVEDSENEILSPTTSCLSSKNFSELSEHKSTESSVDIDDNNSRVLRSALKGSVGSLPPKVSRQVRIAIQGIDGEEEEVLPSTAPITKPILSQPGCLFLSHKLRDIRFIIYDYIINDRTIAEWIASEADGHDDFDGNIPPARLININIRRGRKNSTNTLGLISATCQEIRQEIEIWFESKPWLKKSRMPNIGIWDPQTTLFCLKLKCYYIEYEWNMYVPKAMDYEKFKKVLHAKIKGGEIVRVRKEKTWKISRPFHISYFKPRAVVCVVASICRIFAKTAQLTLGTPSMDAEYRTKYRHMTIMWSSTTGSQLSWDLYSGNEEGQVFLDPNDNVIVESMCGLAGERGIELTKCVRRLLE